MGQRIRRWRLRRKLSQPALGRLVGVTRSAVSQWETGKHAPATENLMRMAEVFQCEVSDLTPTEADMNNAKPKSIDAELRELPKDKAQPLYELFRSLIHDVKEKVKSD